MFLCVCRLDALLIQIPEYKKPSENRRFDSFFSAKESDADSSRQSDLDDVEEVQTDEEEEDNENQGCSNEHLLNEYCVE